MNTSSRTTRATVGAAPRTEPGFAHGDRRTIDARLLAAVVLLVLVTFAVYAPVLRHGFVEWDDPYYVTENPHVIAGLSASGIAWAFRSTELANWHPVTWLSHMLDVSLFGLAPWGHHLTSVLLHLANTLLLFAALRRLTGADGRSLFVAALFALHPLRVESVAWVAERKDVLSTTFWFMALWAYAGYVQARSRGRYALVAACLALGLMAKPMLVSLPFTLLLLDGWPLGRARDAKLATWWPLVVEKLPLFALSLAAAATTWLTQGAHGAMTDQPFEVRLANAVLGYAGYLAKTVWPAGLAAFYPYDPHPQGAVVAMQAVLLLALTAAIAWFGWRRRYLWMGWLWYLVTLVPVIGIVRVGQQQMADRYTYVPLVGVFVMFVWGASEFFRRLRVQKLPGVVAATCAMLLLAVLAFATTRQIAIWKDGVTLWERALAVGGSSTVSHTNLGVALESAGRLEEAATHLVEAIRLEPRNVRAYNNLGNVRFAQGRLPEAIESYEQSLRLQPEQKIVRQNVAKSYYNLANAIWRAGDPEAAVIAYRDAIRWRPDDAALHRSLAMVLIERGRHEEGAIAIRRALELAPADPANHDVHAIALFELGDLAGASREVQACLGAGGTPTGWLVEALAKRMR